MQVLYGAQQVVNDVLRMLHLQVDVRLDDFLEVALGVLHDHVEGVEGLRVIRVEQLDKLNHEGVLQFAHQGHLTENSFAIRLIFKNVLHSFDCDFLASALAFS